MIKKMSSIKLFYLKKKRLVLEGLELAKSKKKKKNMLFTETFAKTESNINIYYFLFYFENVNLRKLFI